MTTTEDLYQQAALKYDCYRSSGSGEASMTGLRAVVDLSAPELDGGAA
ncbi:MULTISPECIES: hypothetical protein [Gordonia]|nr:MULTISPECIES: hypothetical protein [Gordonia]